MSSHFGACERAEQNERMRIVFVTELLVVSGHERRPAERSGSKAGEGLVTVVNLGGVTRCLCEGVHTGTKIVRCAIWDIVVD